MVTAGSSDRHPGGARTATVTSTERTAPMATSLPALTPVEDSLFLTLCCRALDNRSPHPILGDEIADEIVRTLDYDYERLNTNTDLVLNVALRAKKDRKSVV